MEQKFTRAQRKEIAETFSANPSGSFIWVQGYESVNGNGEIANYQLQSGIHYNNIKAKSIEKIDEIKAGKIVPTIHVKCNTYKNDDGTFTSRKAKDRQLIVWEKDVAFSDADFQLACDEIKEGLVNPKKVEQPYEKEATGLYSTENDVLYIRDCLVIKKYIVTPGSRPVSATEPFNAIKNAIRRLLPVDNYRTFKLDLNRFETISINTEKIEGAI